MDLAKHKRIKIIDFQFIFFGDLFCDLIALYYFVIDFFIQFR